MTANLRALLAGRAKPLVAPGASDALSASLIEAHGYECVYIGSYATAASRFGITDTGLLSLEALVEQARTIAAAVRIPVMKETAARRDPSFTIVARSDAFWVRRDLEDCIARLQLYAEAGADMVFPTLVGPEELAAVRRRIAKPIMIVDMPGRPLEEHAGASVVLYYAFSVTRQFSALRQALVAGELASDTQPLEDFLGYKDANLTGSRVPGR